MKCINCPAFWHTEDDGGCYINKAEDKKNGEPKEGCRLGIKNINKTIERFQKEEEEFWTEFIKYNELERKKTNVRQSSTRNSEL